MFCKYCGSSIRDSVRFCTNCGKENIVHESPKKWGIFTKKNILIGTIILIILIIIFISIKPDNLISNSKSKDEDIASSVVNIYCKGINEEESSGGSGTILDEGGLVLTNAHIIPPVNMDEVNCLVTLPNPEDGSWKEIYIAYPIIIPKLSEQYDLAFVQIHDVFYDQEENKAYGEYPKKFPAYESEKYCKSENVKLGESVRIYGYPAISGGYALTITDGIVSSLLPQEGLIITSAKISHGNSGGLAVDKDGCRIGIPSMVSSDENESLGIIISNDLIFEFANEVKNLKIE